MRGVAEALAFGTLAVGLHLALFAAAPAPQAGSAAGAEGAASVSLQGASEGLAQLVERWSIAPKVASAPIMATPRVPGNSGPVTPATAPPFPAAVARSGPAPLPRAPDAASPPQVPAEPPPPPVTDRAPVSAARPPARADVEARAAPEPDATPARERAPGAAPSRRAEGSGAGAAAGESGRHEQPGLTPAQTRSLMAQWGGGIRASVERRLRYPGGTTAAGTARIALSISSSGRLSGARLTASTGHPALDRAAIAAVRDARYPRAPRALPAGTYSFTVPLTLRP